MDTLDVDVLIVPSASADTGIYTKMAKKGGVDERRYWYDRCMPIVGARDVWERVVPTRARARRAWPR